jgi:hypothetical protein
MRRTKSTARRSRMVAACSSSSEDDISLGACQEEAPAPSTDAAFTAKSIHMQVRDTVEGRPFNVNLLRL